MACIAAMEAKAWPTDILQKTLNFYGTTEKFKKWYKHIKPYNPGYIGFIFPLSLGQLIGSPTMSSDSLLPIPVASPIN